jgi:hypothetical protein
MLWREKSGESVGDLFSVFLVEVSDVVVSRLNLPYVLDGPIKRGKLVENSLVACNRSCFMTG